MMAHPISCPSCRRGRTSSIGVIPLTKVFAGQINHEAALASNLFRCHSCQLQFRWPRLGREEAVRLYSQSGNDGTLRYQEVNRQDWAHINRWLRGSSSGAAILDVGCFDGGFLNTVDSSWQRYGIEIDPVAARRSEERGVRIIARDIEELDARYDGQFACVCALDVIEHMEDPGSFLKRLFALASRGGEIIISSGDTDAWTWRLMGSNYWYCRFSEHISFINEHWCRLVASEQKGMEIEHLERFSHADGPDRKAFCRDLLKNVAYRISPGLFAFLRRKGWGGIDIRNHPDLVDSPPFWRTAQDHVIVHFRKHV